MEKEKKKKIGKALYTLATAIAAAIAVAFGLSSCQAQRTITTTAETHQKGDTSIVIHTKTIESYTGTKIKDRAI